MEKIFSRFLFTSDVFRYREADGGADLKFSREFNEVLDRAIEFKRDSQSAFDPFWRGVHDLDLNGLAKGFIVDRVAEFLLNSSSTVSGSINAGGDLRIIRGPAQNEFTLRLGSSEKPKLRKILSAYPCVASSSMSVASERAESTTHYANSRVISPEHTVVVLSDKAIVADALTKVGMFAESSVTKFCSLKWNSQILIFDALGELTEDFSIYENQPAL